MFCTKCQKDLSECTCEDIKERLAKISESPHIATRWCVKCDNHYSQCKCENPVWGIKSGTNKPQEN